MNSRSPLGQEEGKCNCSCAVYDCAYANLGPQTRCLNCGRLAGLSGITHIHGAVQIPQGMYASLLLENTTMRTLLRAAREKLALYRAEHSGEYVGGIEYTTLVREIDAALSSSPLAGGST